MGLVGVIRRFKTGTYTVTRRAAGTMTSGVVTAGAASTFTVDAHVQPARSGEVLEVLPEGHIVNGAKKVFCETELLATAGRPDHITIDGEDYAIAECAKWPAFGDTFWRAIAVRQTTP